MSSQASAIPTIEIETARLILRAPTFADVPEMAALANDSAVALMTGRLPFPYGENDALTFVHYQDEARRAGKELAFAIESKEGKAFLGCIGFRLPKPDAAEIGYWLGRRHWGRGLATEAARALIDHGFDTLPIKTVIGECRVINEPSRRVMEKCGLRYINSGLRAAPARGGALPIDRFCLSRADWVSFKAWQPAIVRESSGSTELAV
ncbi:GNAT family N-acetyltransferase [Labrys monachus]|uniref:RimJ/RimL family protein N-acetyltransferase n=1 Tax=Labrys monachus TaxID=217067 RepID=A0ABU0FPU9_9HYPH|nr:GNAT family N-acetyltransferase [Labrys monachus]MDQ0396075.1 RimJ/RimL family protein N-acetyltransferase [Labrys monachus]